jgi:hypothetical protein
MSLYHTPYDLTAQGIAERWTREKAWPGYDFQGAIERQGINTARRVMRDETDKRND